jgi:hypothetical protein
MSTLAQDRLFLEEAIPQLADFLLSKEVFWPLGGTLPRLTIGSLLLAQARLNVESYFAQSDSVRMRWPAAWENKALQEFRTRLTLWFNFLRDYAASPSDHADRYRQEVRNRAMLHLLAGQLRQPPAELDMLLGLDDQLKGSLNPGAFVWEVEIESFFPQPEYWFLYGNLKSR